MDTLPDSSDNLTTHEWDLVTDILLNLNFGPETSKAIGLLSIPALQALIVHSERIAARQHCLKAEALARLKWLED
jgi:hypothetical protein